MLEIGVAEASQKLGELLDRAEHGEEVVITRAGRQVARLVPASPARDPEAARAALRRLREHAPSLNLGRFNWEEWKQYVDTGWH